MRGKVARRQRALQLSQRNTRLNRKSLGVERNEHEQKLDRLLLEARTERSDALKAANAEHKKAVDVADDKRKKAVASAEDVYLEKRNEIVKRLAGEQEAAA